MLSVLLAGCGASTPPGSTTSADGFTGPWADEFAYFDQFVANSDFADGAFADSRITDAEVEEAHTMIADCCTSHGATVEYDIYGRASVTVMAGTDDPMDVMGTCEFADGAVTVLHGQMSLNPDHLDDFTIQAACLVDQGVADPGFTARDLEEGLQDESVALPWEPGDEVATACMIDPLDLADDGAALGSGP